MIPPIIADSADLNIPISIVTAIVVSMSGAVVFIFRQLIVSHRERITELTTASNARVHEMAEAVEKLTEEIRAQWEIVTRVQHVRLLEMAAMPDLAPKVRGSVDRCISELKGNEK